MQQVNLKRFIAPAHTQDLLLPFIFSRGILVFFSLSLSLAQKKTLLLLIWEMTWAIFHVYFPRKTIFPFAFFVRFFIIKFPTWCVLSLSFSQYILTHSLARSYPCLFIVCKHSFYIVTWLYFQFSAWECDFCENIFCEIFQLCRFKIRKYWIPQKLHSEHVWERLSIKRNSVSSVVAVAAERKVWKDENFLAPLHSLALTLDHPLNFVRSHDAMFMR